MIVATTLHMFFLVWAPANLWHLGLDSLTVTSFVSTLTICYNLHRFQRSVVFLKRFCPPFDLLSVAALSNITKVLSQSRDEETQKDCGLCGVLLLQYIVI